MQRIEKLSDSWETPQDLFDTLDAEFNFSLDLCATFENSKCDFHCDDYLCTDITECAHLNFTVYDCAFMNPPYSNPKPFIEKAWEDSKCCKIVCLVKCDPSTRWWSTFWDYEKGAKPGCEVRFFPKRIKFKPPAGFGGKVSSSAFPCALLIFDRRNV